VVSVPLHPPLAVQDVAFVDVHANVAVPPLAIEVGLPVNVTVGAGTTVTVALAVTLVLPGPMQVNEYEVVVVSGPVLCVPLVPSAPAHPPVAVQDVAPVAAHVSVDVPLLATVIGFAVTVMLSAGTTVIVAVAGSLAPPIPVQVNEYEVVVVSKPLLWLPLGANVPLHPPDAVQLVAFVDVHERVEAELLATEVGLAMSVTVGAGATVTVAVAALLVPPEPVQVNE
jgi:hypothetical protein